MGLKHSLHLAVDTMILIYYLEDHLKYGPLCEKQLEKAHIISTSFLAKAEILTGYYKSGDRNKINELESLDTSIPKLTFHPFGDKTTSWFAYLRNTYPTIKAPDCIMLATALEQKADAFLTNDLQLKQVTEIPILLLDKL